MKKTKEIFVLIAALGIYVAVISLSGIGCPIRYFLGICCAGCGMTRAVASLFMLDFRAAAYYHPLVFLIIPISALYLVLKIKGKVRALRLTVIGAVALLLSVYLVRLIYSDGSVVYIDMRQGAVYKFVKGIIDYFI